MLQVELPRDVDEELGMHVELAGPAPGQQGDDRLVATELALRALPGVQHVAADPALAAQLQRNDERARIKREINRALGSQLVEEKSYQDYRSA